MANKRKSALKKHQDKSFGHALRRAREGHGLTRPVLAQRAGIGVNTLWRYETGATSPQWAVLERLAGAMGMTAASMCAPGLNDPREPLPPEAEKDLEAMFDSIEAPSEIPAGPIRWRLGREHRELAIEIFEGRKDENADLVALGVRLSHEVGMLPFWGAAYRFDKLREENARPDALKYAAWELAYSVLQATGDTARLYVSDIGGVQYSLARAYDASGPTEDAVRLALDVLETPNVSDDETQLAMAVIRRARDFAEKYRPKYKDPWFLPDETPKMESDDLTP